MLRRRQRLGGLSWHQEHVLVEGSAQLDIDGYPLVLPAHPRDDLMS
ncbi:hypothetical protein ACIA5A_30570 [Micromonospora sp. NPDC051300]